MQIAFACKACRKIDKPNFPVMRRSKKGRLCGVGVFGASRVTVLAGANSGCDSNSLTYSSSTSSLKPNPPNTYKCQPLCILRTGIFDQFICGHFQRVSSSWDFPIFYYSTWVLGKNVMLNSLRGYIMVTSG